MRFTPDHEWVRLEGGIATVGITEHAAEALGDIVYLEVKSPGTQLAKGDILGVVESVKAASEIYVPIAGVVAETNQGAVDDPSLIGQSPEGEGWLARLEPTDASEVDTLMDADEYRALLDRLGGER